MKDRLTFYDERGTACYEPGGAVNMAKKVISRLAAYEDTGLTPGEVSRLKILAGENIHEVARLRADNARLNDFEHSQCAKLPEEVGRLRAELEQATITLDQIKRDLNEPDKIYIHLSEYFGRHKQKEV